MIQDYLSNSHLIWVLLFMRLILRFFSIHVFLKKSRITRLLKILKSKSQILVGMVKLKVITIAVL